MCGFMKKWIAASLPVVLASVFAGCGNNGELTPEIKLTIGTEEVVATDRKSTRLNSSH